MARLTRKQFIEKLAPYARADMLKTGVPASLTIAQGILESADGNSTLTVQANNLFGMKGKGTAGSVRMPTKEFVNGEWITIHADFRKYNNWGESVHDHSQLFLNGVSWDRSKYSAIIGKDGITAAQEVAKAGYATDPNYASKLMTIINDNQLLKYDRMEEEKQMSEAERIAKLEQTVRTVVNQLTELSERLQETPAPDWFIAEFPNALHLIHQKTGTKDFWRAFAVTLRIVKQNQNYFS